MHTTTLVAAALALCVGLCAGLYLGGSKDSPREPASSSFDGAPAPVSRPIQDVGTAELAATVIPWLLESGARAPAAAPSWRIGVDGTPALLNGEEEVGSVLIEDGGFRVFLSVRREADADVLWHANTPPHGFVFRVHGAAGDGEEAGFRTLSGTAGRGGLDLREVRSFASQASAPAAPTWVSVEFQILEFSRSERSVGDLLAALERHHGKYVQLCRELRAVWRGR